MERVKTPHNYGPTPDEEEATKRKELTDKEKHEREEREERERDEQETANDRMKKQKDWGTKLEQIKRDEFQKLDEQSAPLRNYLMTHVMPTLTKALIGKSPSISGEQLSLAVLSARMLSSPSRRSGRFRG